MPDSPETLPENLNDTMVRTECLELWNKYFAEIKKKGITVSTKKLVEAKLKEAQNRDTFSFLLLSFLRTIADFVEPNRYEEFGQLNLLLQKYPISRYLREYEDSTQDPPLELMVALSNAMEEVQSKMWVEKPTGLTALQVTQLLQETPVKVD